jgi:uncharacterized integral membrane protein
MNRDLNHGILRNAPASVLDTEGEMMRYIGTALLCLLLVVVLIFSFQNFASVDVQFLTWSVTLPKVFLILGTYLMGMLSGWGLVVLVRAAI